MRPGVLTWRGTYLAPATGSLRHYVNILPDKWRMTSRFLNRKYDGLITQRVNSSVNTDNFSGLRPPAGMRTLDHRENRPITIDDAALRIGIVDTVLQFYEIMIGIIRRRV